MKFIIGEYKPQMTLNSFVKGEDQLNTLISDGHNCGIY